MSEFAVDPGEWRPRSWLGMIVAVTLLQCAILASLSRPRHNSAPRPAEQTRVRVGARSSGQPSLESGKQDPTVFALVNPHGFSGAAWLTMVPLEYQITNSPEPLHWLALPPEDLADDFADFVRTNLVSEDLVSIAPIPAPARVSLPIPLVAADTVVRIESGLPGRKLVAGVSLPRQPEPILTNSVVRVLVDRDGFILSAALLSSSLVAQADLEALRFARAARFLRAPGAADPGELATGTLVFQWWGVHWSAPGGVSGIAANLRRP